jgi:DNA processing protein
MEILAALTLAFEPELLLRDKVKLVEHRGSCCQALAHLPVRKTAEIRERAKKEWHACRQRNLRVVSLTSRHYPALLKEIADPPLALYVWGRLLPEDAISLAVVGSRRATPYGIEACERLSHELAGRGATIVSGLARGIDAAAHRAALTAGGRTLAVLGSGLDVIYPRENLRLAEGIAQAGAVLSEFPLGTPPLPGHFPRRNRIISGLALGTIVVEAAERSGSLISARIAAEENREVFAIPGPVVSPTSRGTHRLIQNGAKLVVEAHDVIEELRPDVQKKLQRSTGDQMKEQSQARTDPLSRDERLVLDALARNGTLDAERLVHVIGLSADRVGAALVSLEIKGRVRPFGSGFFRIRGEAPASS